MRAHLGRSPARQRGMGIVETMVGILIGMVVVLAIYNVFALAEGYKRTTVGVADAQTTGLVAQFILSREIGNAGTGLALAGGDLARCTTQAPNWFPSAGLPAGFFSTGTPRSIRPIPVLIMDGGANRPDALVVTYATPSRVINSVLVVDQAMANPLDPIYVQSPNGFRVNDRIILRGANGDCEMVTVTGVVAGDHLFDPTTGMVGLQHSPLAYTNFLNYPPGTGTAGPGVINLGQAGESTQTLFEVGPGPAPCDPSKLCQLRTTDLLTPGATAVPIAQNIVLLKAQYGIDCAGNGVVTWTSATASGVCGRNYTPEDLAPPAGTVGAPGMNSTQYAQWLSRIRAVRIAIVVRSDEADLKDPALVGQTATLFDCSAHNATCQGSIAISSPTLADGWRHRIYETIVPMRNAIYNNGT